MGQVVDPVEARDVGHDRAATDVEEDPVGVQFPVVDAQGVRIREMGVSANHGAAVHAGQPILDTLAVGQHDAILARLDLRHVHADPPGRHTVIGAATGQLGNVRAGHQRLGWDAPGVDAGAADQFALDDRDALPGGGQPSRKRGSGLAGTDDDRVEMFAHLTADSRYSVSR